MKWMHYLTLAAAFIAGGPRALSYDAIYAFGDSLTDTGREPAEPYLHYDGRWSNGPLWVEYLSGLLGFPYNPDNNLAHSGAQTDDTFGQVAEFMPTTDVANSLFVVWAGGNDFLQEYDKNWFDDDKWDRQIAYSVGNLSNAVVNLYSKGARTILVPNTVDVTDIPLLNFLPGFVSDYLQGKVEQFNRELAEALNQIQAANPALVLFQFDFFGQVHDLLSHSQDYGFTEKDVDALSDVTLLDKRFDGPGANYVFWDPIHPTTKSHGIIAEWFQATVMPASPQIAIAADGPVLNLSVGNSRPGQTFVLQRSSDMIEWTDVDQLFGGAAPRLASSLDGSPRAFFRLKLQQR